MAIKIYIDQGHNPRNPNAGAEGNGLREQDITYRVGQELAVLVKQTVVNNAVCLGNTDSVDELTDSGCRVASAAHTAKSYHSRVIPTADNAFFNKLKALTLTCLAVVYVKTCKLNLSGRLFKADLLKEPVVERSVVFELK